MTPTDLDIAFGDATTVPEETAWGAFQTLKAARTNPDFATDPNLARTRDSLRSYLSERSGNNHAIFPNVVAAANRKRNDLLTGLYTKPLSEALPAANFTEIERRAAFTADPDEFRQRTVNRSFLSATLGRDIPPEQYDAVRQIYAVQHLGLKADTGDKAVFSAIQGRFKEEQATTTQLRSLSASAFQGIFKPESNIPSTLTKEHLQAFPERLRENAAAQYSETVRSARRAKRHITPIVDRMEKAFAELTGDRAENTSILAGDITHILDELPENPKDRELALGLLARRFKDSATNKEYSDRLDTGLGRSFTSYVEDIINPSLLAGARLRDSTIDSIAGTDRAMKGFRKTEQYFQDARRLRDLYYNEKDPIESAADGYIAGGLILATQSVPYFAASFLGPFGIGSMAASMSGSSYQQARDRNPEADSGAQMLASFPIGIANAATETIFNKLGAKLVFRKMPGLSGILNKFSTGKYTRAAIGGVARGSGVLGGEYIEEALQGATDRYGQDLALEFSKIDPKTDWDKFWGDWISILPGGQSPPEEQQKVLQTILTFAVIGAGGGSIAHFKYGQALAQNANVLHTYGFKEEHIKAIVTSSTPEAMDAAIKEGHKDLEARTTEQKAGLVTFLRELATAREAAGVPTVSPQENSFTGETTYAYTDPLTREEVSFDTEEEALFHWRDQAALTEESEMETILRGANPETIDFLRSEGKAGESIHLDEQNMVGTLPAMVKNRFTTQAQIDANIRMFILQNGLTPEQAVKETESLVVKAQSYVIEGYAGQRIYAVRTFQGHDPMDIFEDFAESSYKQAVDGGFANPQQTTEDILGYQLRSGETLLPTGYTYSPENRLPLIEAYSKLARAAVIGSANTGLLPESTRQWINLHTSIAAFNTDRVDVIAADIRRAGTLRSQIAQGEVPASLMSLISDSIGINEAETFHRLETKHREQLAAEAMEGFPEIQEQARGLLPHPETLRKNSHPLTGEAQRIYDALKKPTRRRDSQGRQIDRTNEANAYFLPFGEMADIDLVRRRMNEKGFDFDTPAELLEALDSSIAYGKPVYGTNSKGNDSFSIGRAWPAGFPNVAIHTTVGKIKSHPSYDAAKAGSTAGAFAVVRDTTKPERLKALAQQHPKAIVAALDGEEATGLNRLPAALATRLATIGNLALDESLVMVNKPKRTGSSAVHRLASRPEFAGEVSTGREYILVDDVATQGGTVSEARAYIEENGGKVVAVMTLAAAQGGTVIALQPKTKLALEEKFGEDSLDEFATKTNLYGGQWQAITNSEGNALLKYSQLQTATDRILAERQEASNTGTPGTPQAGDGKLRDSFSIGSITPEAFTQALIDRMGEDALRLEQPRVSYDDKRQILLDFSQSILGSDQAGNQPGSDSGRRSGLSVIRQRLADQLNADLKIDFIGEQVADIEALAVKAQALRNPRFETFYLLAIKFSGKKAMKVVDAMAVSARVPSSAPIFEDGKSWDEGFPNHVQFLKDAEADSYILIHNHPSGDSTPSGADIRITAKHGTDMVNAGGPPLMQHIVINHQEFTTIDRLGSTTRKTLDTFAPDPFAWPHPGTEIRQDASAPEKIVAIAQGMEEAKKNPDLLIGFFLNAKMQVVKSLQGTTEDFLSADYAAMVMGARDQGGIYLVVHGQQDHHSKATDLVDRLKPLNDLGMLLEAVIEFPRTATGMTYWSALSQGSFKPSPVFFGADEAFKVSRVQEDAASFSLSPQGINRLEKAIAQRLTAAPIERAQFYERVRNRLAGLTQQLEDMENGIGVFSRKPTDEIGAERRRIQDAIAEAKAIVSSLPIEARGRVSIDFTDITSKETEKGRIKALLRLIADADAALETVLKTQYLQAFEKLLDLAAPDLRQNRQIRGRLTPETQRLVNAVIPLIHLTPNEASAALIAAQAAYDAVEAQYPDPTDQEAVTAWEAALTKHQEQVDLLNTFAALTNGTASEIAQAHKELLSIYTRGRTARQILDQYKRQETASMRRELIDSLGGPVSQPKWARRTKDIGFKDKAQSALLGMSSFHQVANYLFPDSAVMPVILARLRTAERDVTRQRILARKRFEEFGRTAFNLTGKRAIRKLNGIIAAVSTRRDDWNIEIAEGTKWETVKMSEEQAASILDGTLKPGWEGDLIAMESLRQSLADFRLQRLTAQNDAKAFTKSVIRFQRLTARGARAFLEMSDMEALYFLQLADQEQYLPALDRYGFTASVLEKIRKKIDPRATTFGIHLRTEYDAQWGRLNPVHQAIYGLDMPRIRNYAPGMFESMNSNSNVSPEGDAPAVNAMSTGFTKARTHHMARPKQSNALLNYWTSMETTEYFIAYGELMRDMRQVFRSPDVRRTIEGNYGIKAANDFSTLLDVLEIDGRVRALKAQFLAETTQNVLASQSAIGLAFNAGSVLKQVSAGFNHLIEIPLGPGIKATAKAVADPKILKLVWESESVQQRIEEGISPEDKRLLSAAHAASFPGSKVSTSEIVKWFNAESMYRINQGRMPIAWGDAVFTTLTGAAAYKYQYDRAIASGLSDSQAHQAGLDFMDHVITNTAQPATTQDKSLNEITATGAGGLLKIFRSDPRQKLAISANAVALASRGKMSWKEAGRRLFVAWYLYGITGSVLTIIARAVLHDDDDPEEWTIRDLLAGAIAGPISGFGLIGGIIETTIQSTVGTGGFVNSANPLDKSMATTIRTVSGLLDGDELTIRDAHRAAAAAAQVGGAFNPNLAIIPAFMRIVRDATGLAGNIGDVMFDESEEEVQRRIIREEKAATREKSTDRTAELDSLAEALAKLSPDKRDARLKALDKETRARVLPRVRKASMTPEERSLSTMSLASREKAIARILESLPENRRQSFQDRIKDIGLTE